MKRRPAQNKSAQTKRRASDRLALLDVPADPIPVEIGFREFFDRMGGLYMQAIPLLVRWAWKHVCIGAVCLRICWIILKGFVRWRLNGRRFS